jgi:hypothetical protein
VVKHFPLWYRLNAEDRYLIWLWNEQAEQTSLLIDTGGFIPSFGSSDALCEYAALSHYGLESEETRLHDLDWVASWTLSRRKRVDCKEVLAAWNLFADVAASIGERGSAFKRLIRSYRKLFTGSFSGGTICLR